MSCFDNFDLERYILGLCWLVVGRDVRHDVKKELYDLVLKTKNEKHISFLIATSNITEAVYLSSRIIQLSKHPGKIINEINVADFIKTHGKDSTGKIKSEIESGMFNFDVNLEDIHMNIEARLIDIVGDVGKKLHTARSRNDQVATDLKIYTRNAFIDLRVCINGLLNTILNI